MSAWTAWLWIAPVFFSCVGCAAGLITGNQALVGKSLLVLAGTLSLARVGDVATFPL